MMRRHVAFPLAAMLVASAVASQTPVNVLTAGISEIQSAVDAGSLTYEMLVQRYLARIEAFDRKGPRLRAILSVNPRAAA